MLDDGRRPARQGGGARRPLIRRRSFPLLLVPLVAACRAAPVPTVSQCLAEHRASAGAMSPEQLERFCYFMLSDQARLTRLHATARIYEDQVYQSHVMLYMVVFITLSGVILAGLQLWASYRLASCGKGTLADGGDLTFKPDDVAVKSSVVGVIILAISLAFFSIFVAQVYKITPLAVPSVGGGGGDTGNSADSTGEVEPVQSNKAASTPPAADKPPAAAQPAAPPKHPA